MRTHSTLNAGPSVLGVFERPAKSSGALIEYSMVPRDQAMFSGIVEAQGQVLEARNEQNLVRIKIQKPLEFNDLRIGDSIATNGVCLTVEKFDSSSMTFALGAETLQVTGWTAQQLQGTSVNLERSLRFGDRVHGHMVSGHVDGVGEVVLVEDLGGSTRIDIRMPKALEPFVWKKGSWALNGVSLTVNTVENGVVSHVLIPETLKRTNLGRAKPGDRMNVEVDMLARGFLRALELGHFKPDLAGFAEEPT